MMKSYTVERVAMIGGGNSYNVLEKGSWDTHSSKHDKLFSVSSRRPQWLNDTDFPPLSDRRFKMVTAYYSGLQALVRFLTHKAFPETRSSNGPNSLWLCANLPGETRKIKY